MSITFKLSEPIPLIIDGKVFHAEETKTVYIVEHNGKEHFVGLHRLNNLEWKVTYDIPYSEILPKILVPCTLNSNLKK